MKIPSLSKYLNSEWKDKTLKVNRHLESVYRIFKKKHYPTADDLFFELEDLPYLGKEYWFLYFCAPPNKEQVVLTLGRSIEPVKVNDTHVHLNATEGSVPCAAVCWFYTNKKQVVFDSIAEVSIGKRTNGKGIRSLCAENGKSEITISGNYPKYDVELVKDGKRVFTAQAFPPKHGMPFEMVHLLKSPIVPRFGAAMINYYFDFKGELEGKKLQGKAYLQKVVAVLPLAPWNWVRVHFTSGAILDFFAGKPIGTNSEMHFACNDFLEIKGRRIKMRDLKLTSRLSGDKRLWILSGKHLYCVMESYSVQPFIMKQKTTFRYDEYLVKVSAFAYRDAGGEYSLVDLGEGIGLVEDASGYLL
jgi:hypothetical protein